MILVYIILTLGDVSFKNSRTLRDWRDCPHPWTHPMPRPGVAAPCLRRSTPFWQRASGRPAGSAGWGDMKRAVPSNIINHHHQLVTSGMLPTRLCDVMCISILWPFNIAMESHRAYIYIFYIYVCVCVIGKNWTNFERAIKTIAKC